MRFPIHPSGLMLAVCLAIATAHPAAAGPRAADAAVVRIDRPEFRAYALRDSVNAIPNDGKVFGVGVDPARVDALLKAAGAPTSSFEIDVDALLVRMRTRLFLVDTGLGPAVGGALMESLRRAGVSPDEITDVLITHAHGDHIGGLLTAEGRPAFPKATVRMSDREWTSLKAQAEERPLVAAIGPQVRAFHAGARLAPGVRSRPLYGHTPGHVGYEFGAGRERLIDFGDIAHSPIVSMQRPEWKNGYDADAQRASAIRTKTLAALAKTHELVFSPHMPFPGFGRISKQGGMFAWRSQSN